MTSVEAALGPVFNRTFSAFMNFLYPFYAIFIRAVVGFLC